MTDSYGSTFTYLLYTLHCILEMFYLQTDLFNSYCVTSQKCKIIEIPADVFS